MKNVKYVPGIIKCLLLVAFLFNVGVLGGLHDLFTQGDNQVEKANEVLRAFTVEKIRLAEGKVQLKEHYTEEEYYADLAAIFRKMKELGLKPGIPTGINLLRSIQFGGRVQLGKHSEIAKVVFHHPDIEEYFQSSEPLVKKDDLVKFPSWLWTMYLKNFCLALIFLLLECRTNKSGLRNPLSFILLIVFYPVTIGYIFYKWFRFLGRSYMAEAEFRQTKEKLFTLLSQDEIAQIKKFAESNISFASWRKGFVLRHSFLLALFATMVIAVIPKQVQANKGFIRLLEGGAAQIAQHLPRMDIEDDSNYGSGDFLDYLPKVFICQVCEMTILRRFSGLVYALMLFSFQEVTFSIDHIPINSRCLTVK